MLILTCKLGNEIINCYDGTHDKEQLKKWASKKILLCPVCGKSYEYCHGKVKTPYFRHMDKNECEDLYSESETEEHLNGKRDLFEWIKKQNGVTNAVLEGWIPETKQRPDIMFEYGGKKYVIEYQCSPIATEYVERHALYRASGIIDIWVCGTKKYLELGMREKYLEQHSIGFYDSSSKKFIIGKYTSLYDFLTKVHIKNSMFSKQISYDKCGEYLSCNLTNCAFNAQNLIVPVCFYSVTYKESINIHEDRKKRAKELCETEREKQQYRFERILEKYCKSFNGLSLVKCEKSYIGFINSTYEITDKLTKYNENTLVFHPSYSSYSQLKEIYQGVKAVIDRRQYLLMLTHLEKVFRNKLVGEYSVAYKNFGEGEYIDVEYKDFVVRSVIQNMTLKISIHDDWTYMKKNYQLVNTSDYNRYSEIILDVIKYTNFIFENNLKVNNALNRFVSFSNQNWLIDYTKSSFNLAEVKMYPIDNEGNKWESIGLLKLNANFDKNINLSISTEDEILEYMKNHFHKKLLRFFKTGIKSYYTSDKRLVLKHREVNN